MKNYGKSILFCIMWGASLQGSTWKEYTKHAVLSSLGVFAYHTASLAVKTAYEKKAVLANNNQVLQQVLLVLKHYLTQAQSVNPLL